ncbi:ABC transporter substrate-binding protein [Pseudomonas sp. RIT412]|nr:ABC transporter substrate-binding protein [Pseudomonas sp. RIT 409]RAU54969.1 ABC transporter substrate-binding protein [Pseudomonas sp. RIT 412]
MLKPFAAMTLLTALLTSAGSTSAAEPLTVISFGGAAKVAQDKAFYQPFNATAKGTIQAGEYNGEMSKIRAMVETGQVSWDVVEVESPDLVRGCSEGLFEPLDWSKIGEPGQFEKSAVSECGIGMYFWSTVLTYNADKLKTAPTGWAAYWDTKTFPGKRGLRKSAKFTLEIALLADGVKPQDLYTVLSTPEGVDRAFKKLDLIKHDIQWWEAGAQPLQWLVAGDVVMTTAYNGRVTSARNEGHAFTIVWDQSLYDLDSWAIVKGSPHKALGEQYIAFVSQPQQQKVFAETIPYRPTNKQAMALLDANTQKNLPDIEKGLQVSTQFWIDHGEELEQRFNAWAAR